MVYELDTLINSNAFYAQAGAQLPVSSGAQITWNGLGIHSIAGPTPFISIETSTEKNEDESIKSIVTKFNLNGTIINTGLSNVTNKIMQLNSVFNSGCKNGILALTYNNTVLLSWAGVKFLSSNFGVGNDQWTKSCPYTISLEQTVYAISGYRVKDMKDDWIIEQLEDQTYQNITMPAKQQIEYHNPQVGPGSPPTNPSRGQPSIGRPPTSTYNLNIYNMPQFRVSRTVSAVGRASSTHCVSGIDNSAYLEAKRWVEDRAKATWSSSILSTTGMMKQTTLLSTNPNANTIVTDFGGESSFFHNYLKTTNLDILKGSYEITENFLVLPNDIGYFEEYQVDMSTNEQYITTVRVQGTVNGLSLFMPEYTNRSVVNSGQYGSSTIDLEGSVSPRSTEAGTKTTTHLDSFGKPSFFPKVSTSKYGNAVSGWMFDIKPYLYRRACLVTNSSDRDRDYVPFTRIGGPTAVNNPMFSYQAPVNIIPVSTSETHDPRKGTVSYSYEFNNQFRLISGTLYENINIEDTMPNDIISEVFVLNRALGPILEDLNTVTSAHKSVSIEVGVVPPSSMNGLRMVSRECPLYISGATYKTIDEMLAGFRPFNGQTALFGNVIAPLAGQSYVESDTQTWQATDGKYSRTVRWIYQQCGNQMITMEH